MSKVRILLCCGAGISSGMLASNVRKAIKKQKADATCEARSTNEVGDFLSTVDVVLLGPHYSGQLQAFKDRCEPHGVKVNVIPKDVYAMLDGATLLEMAQKMMTE